jgi:putative glutamine amidotransferase
MTLAPLVLVTATTEAGAGVARVCVPAAYTDALVAVGLIPVVLPPVSPAVATAALDGVAGLVLTGGEDIDPRLYHEAAHPATGTPHAARDAYELALARAARARRVPTLAICRGAQIVNVALGGTLMQDISPRHPRGVERVHAVELDPSSRLASIFAAPRVRANSSHHQAIGRAGPGLRVGGTSPDGVVEAIESADPAWWMMGVQWHPEDLTGTDEDWDRRLFAAFADEARDCARDVQRYVAWSWAEMVREAGTCGGGYDGPTRRAKSSTVVRRTG